MTRLEVTGWHCCAIVLLGALPATLLGQAAADQTAQFSALYDAGKYAEAEAYARRVLSAQAGGSGQATWQHNLAMSLDGQGKYKDAEPIYRQSLATLERVLGAEHPNVALSLTNLANTESHLGKFAEAEAHYLRAIAIRRKNGGADNPELIESLVGIAGIYTEMGRYKEVEPLYQQALSIVIKVAGKENMLVATIQQNLGALYLAQGRFSEAERILKQSLALAVKLQGPKHPDQIAILSNLGAIYIQQGRYPEAEETLRRGIDLGVSALGPKHPHVATVRQNLGGLLESQRRFEEADGLLRQALAIWEEAQGPEHPYVATSLRSLASVAKRQDRLEEAERLERRAVAICEKGLGLAHQDTAKAWLGLAHTLAGREQFADSEALYLKALNVFEQSAGPDHPEVIVPLNHLAALLMLQKDDAKALPYLERALQTAETRPLGEEHLNRTYSLRAEIHWNQGRRDQAIADAWRSLELAESTRIKAIGTEFEQGEALSTQIDAAELLIGWLAEQGDFDGVLDAIERHRARFLADQMQIHGVDLLKGLPAAQAAELRAKESAAQIRLSSARSRLESFATLTPEAQKGIGSSQEDLERAVAEAEKDWLQTYREIRAVSPAYRLVLATERRAPTMVDLQSWLNDQTAWLLEYYLGDERSFALVVPPNGQPQLVPLFVDASATAALGIAEGPLTAEMARNAIELDGTSLNELWLVPEKQAAIEARLQALWSLLVPAAIRQAISDGQIGRLTVVPDGAICDLPIEALLVDASNGRKYLLDVGPPLVYAPSATIALELAARSAARSPSPQAVLTVGDPAYESAASTGPPSVRTRYTRLGGQLTPLPYSGNESAWVSQVFSKQGIGVTSLRKQQATEAAIRAAAPGRRIVHLACHGLADGRYGNLFGALAVTPGADASSTTADDGMLTLAEIYQLDLSGCELAILSACETNVGPQQRGEGQWALSRGFLVAGSRRVAASNWLVDDEAAATLVSYLCNGIAESKAESPDYAGSLQQAKRWIRQQSKWENPYYWASFVLVGTN